MERKIRFFRLSERIFLLGIFLLPSIMSIGVVLILLSSIINLFLNRVNPTKNKHSSILILISILMIAACLYQTFNFDNNKIHDWDVTLTWLGLANWLPFFFLFWSSQSFLEKTTQRIKVAKLLIAGSVPILITGFGQYFFKWEGPFSFLNGIVTWYLKPIESHAGLSGLFSNQNYAGNWMAVIWPLLIGIFFVNKNKNFKRYINISLIISFTIAIILTTSRNALLGLSISLPIIFGIKSLFIIFIFLSFLYVLSSSFLAISSITEIFANILPEQLINKFNKIGLHNLLEYRRINLWHNTLNLLIKKPIFGYGAAFFSIIYAYKFQDPIYTEEHTHNLFLELAFSYGLIVSILLIYFIFSIFFNALKTIKIKNEEDIESKFDKTWMASSFVMILSQMSDITYYDGRISIIFWILITGLDNIKIKKN